MAYLVRARHRTVLLREGESPSDRKLTVTRAEWVRFERLPRVTLAGHDPDVEVRVEEEPPAPAQAELPTESLADPVAETEAKIRPRRRSAK
jgi:hypothetical protein